MTMVDMIDRYRSQRCTWDEFVRRLWPAIVRQIQISSNGNRQEAIEAVGDFYPVLQRITLSYRDTGSSFDAYLRTNVRYFCRKRQYQSSRHRGREIPTEPESAIFDGLVVHESIPDTMDPKPYPFSDYPVQSLRSRDSTRRQVLFILFSNLPVLSGEQLERYAALLAVPIAWITALQSVAITIVEPRRDRRLRLVERRDRHFALAAEYERRIPNARTREHRRRFLRRLQFHRDRWRSYDARLRRFRCTLSHSELSLLLGIPKGSIDSAMNQFRRKVEDTGIAV